MKTGKFIIAETTFNYTKWIGSTKNKEEDCPSQSMFIRELLAREHKRIESWKGYKTLNNSYGICQRTLPLNFKNLEQRLYEEFNRLRTLESSIDRILSDL